MTTINIQNATNSPIATGENATQTTTYHQGNTTEKINENNRDQVLFAAIELFREQQKLTQQQSNQLAHLQIELADKNVDESLWAKLGIKTGLPADLITIGTAIAAYLGM